MFLWLLRDHLACSMFILRSLQDEYNDLEDKDTCMPLGNGPRELIDWSCRSNMYGNYCSMACTLTIIYLLILYSTSVHVEGL